MSKSIEIERISLHHLWLLSVVAAIGGLLFGYDTAVVSGTVADVQLQFSLSSLELGWFVGCALLGSIAGVSIAGVLSDRYGRKRSMIFAAVMFTVSAMGCMLCDDFLQLIIYRIIGGIGIGIVSIVSPMYIAEVAPAKWRGSMVALYQFAITMGFLLAYITNYFIMSGAESGYSDRWLQWLLADQKWRGMLGAETIPAILFFVTLFFIPESQRWLTLHRRAGEAQTTDSGNGQGWKMLFRPGIFKAVVVGSAIALLGQFMGVNAVLYYGPSIFEDAGLSGSDSLMSQVLIGIVNMLTTLLAIGLIDRVGRKQLIYWGVSGMICALVFIGVFFIVGEQLHLNKWLLLVAFLFYIFCCAISICAVVFVLLSEMYPNSVRGRAMSIAGLSLWIGTYLVGQLTPWLLATITPSGTFFLFAGMCIPYIYIMWHFVPETTGRTLEDIENYWLPDKSQD